jgi:hypothetical protein
MSHPSPRVTAPPCLPLGIRPTEGGLEAFAFCLRLLLWAFGFGLGFSLWAFWYGKLLEGKRIAKERLIERLHENFNIGFRKARPKKKLYA